MHELVHGQHEMFTNCAMHVYLIAPCNFLINLYGQHELFRSHALHENLYA